MYKWSGDELNDYFPTTDIDQRNFVKSVYSEQLWTLYTNFRNKYFIENETNIKMTPYTSKGLEENEELEENVTKQWSGSVPVSHHNINDGLKNNAAYMIKNLDLPNSAIRTMQKLFDTEKYQDVIDLATKLDLHSRLKKPKQVTKEPPHRIKTTIERQKIERESNA